MVINKGNLFVSYLNRYITVSPEHEAAFDEFVTQIEPSYGIEFRLDTKTEQFLKGRFRKEYPPSIILTGNAGDGKTYLCRRIIETFINRPVTTWESSNWPIQRGGLTLQVVKDLSEVGDSVGIDVLRSLQQSMGEQVPSKVFLIAANEGRLRVLLGQSDLLTLAGEVDKQLANGPAVENERLVVLNLNRVTTSSYVLRTLDSFTQESRWAACQSCTALNLCPIRFNRDRLADNHIARRLQLLYQILEHLDVHVTIRDMLIHLAYTITGGLTCDEIITQSTGLGWHPQNFVYYENVWNNFTTAALASKLTVAHFLRRLDVGPRAHFAADDFIINGSPDNTIKQAEHDSLFASAVDLNRKEFGQVRTDYLHGGAESPKDETEHPLLDWLPHCRRKLYFEWSDSEKAYSLIPFIFLSSYLRLIGGDKSALLRIKPDLVKGLNRAFSGLFIPNEDSLYVTSQYSHAVEQPVPVIRLKRSLDNIKLEPFGKQGEAFDCDQNVLRLTLLHPKTGEGDAIAWDINLLRFEYLMRLAEGETHNILSEECDLSIRKLKDQLLTSFGSSSESDGQIEFFSVERNRYVVKHLYIEEEKIRT